MTSVTRHKTVALLALIGLFVSAYLLLYTLGFYGDLVCGAGSCEVVQTSRYAVFLGVPVPAWGVAWYGAVSAVAFVLVAGRRPPDSGPGRLLALLATAGLAFTAYLTAIEAFVLEAWCRWCVVSAVLSLGIFLLVAPWRRLRQAAPTPRERETTAG